MFKRKILIVFVVIVVCLSGTVSFSENIDICYFNPDAAIMSVTDALASVQPFINYLNSKIAFNEGDRLVWNHFVSAADLEQFIAQDKVEFCILNSIYFLEKRMEMKFEPILLPLRNGDVFFRKVIVVKTDSEYTTLEELKGKKLLLTSGGSENYPFINRVIFRDKIKIEEYFELMKVEKSSAALFSLLLGNADAALVTEAAFDYMAELTPRVKTQLKIIHTSEKINLTPLTYIQGNVSEDYLEKVKKAVAQMSQEPGGEQTLLVFKVSAWRECSMADFKDMIQLLAPPEGQQHLENQK